MVVLALLLALWLTGCTRYVAAPINLDAAAQSLESRSLDDPGLKQFIETCTSQPLAEWPLPSWDFERLSVAGLFFHSDLKLALMQRHTAQAAEERAAAHPNPTLSVAPEYSIDPESGVSPWLAAINIDFPIETAGKRRLRMTEAKWHSDASTWRVLAAAREIRKALRSAVIDHEAAGEKLKLLDSRLSLQRQALALFDQQKSVGEISETEIMPARTTYTSTLIERDATQGEYAASRARIAAAIGIPVSGLDGVELVSDLKWQPLSKDGRRIARRFALEHRPDIREALSLYEASQAALQLEIAKQYPDLRIGPGYQYDQGQNKWSLGIGLEIPLFNRNEGPIAEAYAKREEAAARVLATQAGVIRELDAATCAMDAATARLVNAERLGDLGNRNVQSLTARNAAGIETRIEVLIARSEQLAAELNVLDARVEAMRAHGDWLDSVQMGDDFHGAAVLDGDSASQAAVSRKR